MFKVEYLGAGTDEVRLALTRGLRSWVLRLVGAECLRTIYRVLRCDEHGDGIVDGENGQCEHDGCDEQGLRRSPATANLEDTNPEEANTHSCDARDGAAEEEENQERHKNVVNWKYAGEFDKNPVERLKDVDAAEDVATLSLADRVLGFIDAREKH